MVASRHNGDAKGTFERLVEIETYVTKPAADKDNGHIVFYFPDVFGFFTNGLLVSAPIHRLVLSGGAKS
jgi:hypothetical protein